MPIINAGLGQLGVATDFKTLWEASKPALQKVLLAFPSSKTAALKTAVAAVDAAVPGYRVGGPVSEEKMVDLVNAVVNANADLAGGTKAQDAAVEAYADAIPTAYGNATSGEVTGGGAVIRGKVSPVALGLGLLALVGIGIAVSRRR